MCMGGGMPERNVGLSDTASQWSLSSIKQRRLRRRLTCATVPTHIRASNAFTGRMWRVAIWSGRSIRAVRRLPTLTRRRVLSDLVCPARAQYPETQSMPPKADVLGPGVLTHEMPEEVAPRAETWGLRTRPGSASLPRRSVSLGGFVTNILPH